MTLPTHRPFIVGIVLLAALLSGCATSPERGYASREMEGIAGVEVVSAQVQIDLRPLADRAPAEITSTYQLLNPNADREVEWFVPCPTQRFAAQLNGVDLTVEPREHKPAPTNAAPSTKEAEALKKIAAEFAKANPKEAAKMAEPKEKFAEPKETPRAGSATRISYEALANDKGFAFRTKLPKGESTLRITYRSPVTAYTNSNPRIWQCVHHFAPAAKWSKFGLLELIVELPPGWKVAANYGLERNGDRLAKTFAKLPAESLLLATEYSPAERKWNTVINWIIAGAVIAITVILACVAVLNGKGWLMCCWYYACSVWIAGGIVSAFVIMRGGDSIPENQRGSDAFGGCFEFIAWPVLILINVVLGAILGTIVYWLAVVVMSPVALLSAGSRRNHDPL